MSQLIIKTLRSNLSGFLKQPLQIVGTQRPVVKSTAHRMATSYDGDGRSHMSILNTNTDFGLAITEHSQYGFRLNNGLIFVGPMAIFPRSVLSWNVSTINDINEESLSLFYVLEPKLDVLILGIGDTLSRTLSIELAGILKKYKINVEVLQTEQACATFNFLNMEQRMVAAALIPQMHMRYNEDDVIRSKLQKKEFYEKDW